MVLRDTFTVSVTLSRDPERLYTNDWSYYCMIEYYEHMAELNSPSSVRVYHDPTPDYEELSPLLF